MLIRRHTTNLLQISYELLLYSQVIFKSMKVPDDTFWRKSKCEWVKLGKYVLASYQRVVVSKIEMPGVLRYNQLALAGGIYSVVYCKSLKYSGNNKIAIIALCPYALL